MNRSGKCVSRRDVIKGLVVGTVGSGLPDKSAKANPTQPARDKSVNPLAATFPIWQLDRPAKPALPSSYFWTWDHRRYRHAISAIKEGCLRAYRTGFEGVSIIGEVSSMHIPCALNYLAFSHFIHWPEDSLRDWGRKTLGQVLGSEDEGEAFAELFAPCDADSLTKAEQEDLRKRTRGLENDVYKGLHLQRYRFWNWLHAIANNKTEPQTISLF